MSSPFAIVGTPTDGFSVWRLVFPSGAEPYYGRCLAHCPDYAAAVSVRNGLESLIGPTELPPTDDPGRPTRR